MCAEICLNNIVELYYTAYSPARTKQPFLESQQYSALTRVKHLETDLLNSNKLNNLLNAKSKDKDKVIKAQQDEINKLYVCCNEFKNEAIMQIQKNDK